MAGKGVPESVNPNLGPPYYSTKQYHVGVLLEGFVENEGPMAELVCLPPLHEHAFKLLSLNIKVTRKFF